MLGEEHTFEGHVARRAFAHSEGRVPNRARVERERILAQALVRRDWLHRKARRVRPRHVRRAA